MHPSRAVGPALGGAVLALGVASCADILGMDPVAELAADAADGSAPALVDGAAPGADGEAVPSTDDASTDARIDAPFDGSVGCTGAACERFVFVTSTPTTGALDGIVGADARCQTRAAASPLAHIRGRQFVAWISTYNNAVRDRVVAGTAAYKRVDGVVIAANFAAFASAAHQAHIDLDEAGVNVGDSAVWTGTTSTGAGAVNGDCNGWVVGTNTDQGVYGLTRSLDARWTNVVAAQGCQITAHLYCVER